jgi:hypothetical protein
MKTIATNTFASQVQDIPPDTKRKLLHLIDEFEAASNLQDLATLGAQPLANDIFSFSFGSKYRLFLTRAERGAQQNLVLLNLELHDNGRNISSLAKAMEEDVQFVLHSLRGTEQPGELFGKNYRLSIPDFDSISSHIWTRDGEADVVAKSQTETWLVEIKLGSSLTRDQLSLALHRATALSESFDAHKVWLVTSSPTEGLSGSLSHQDRVLITGGTQFKRLRAIAADQAFDEAR